MPSPTAKSRSKARAAARLAAVQALYQQEMEKTPLPQLLTEFHQHRLGATIEEAEYIDADVMFFDDIVKGVDARRDEIDALIAKMTLAEKAGQLSLMASAWGGSTVINPASGLNANFEQQVEEVLWVRVVGNPAYREHLEAIGV